MTPDRGQPVAAVLTPPGRGGIAVIAVTGPGTSAVIEGIFRPLRPGPLTPESMRLGDLISGDQPVDEALVCVRDDTVELHIHGGPAVVAEACDLLADQGVRIIPAADAPPALPLAHPRWNNPAIGGELQAMLPRAATAVVAAALSHQWSGGISELVAGRDGSPDQLRAAAGGLRVMERLLQPTEVVLVGPPNAGKSTLANALIGRDVSIVHDTPGTTRDWVREQANLQGLPIWLTDTAGLWNAPGKLDAQAVELARSRAAGADLIVLVEADQPLCAPDWLSEAGLLRVASKTDRHPPADPAAIAVSAATGEGLDDLASAILDKLGLGDFDPAVPRAFTNRQADCLRKGADGEPHWRDALLGNTAR
jgi:tRNA modification GTPase